MSAIFSPTREQARRFFIEAWRKHRTRGTTGVLSPIEYRVVEIVLMHPEYHGLLDDAEQALGSDYPPERGETNPFLHLSLHLAIEEQLGIDQPPGIRSAFEAQLTRLGDRHDALHVALECLAEAIWRSHADGKALDGVRYVECVRRGKR